MTQRWHIHLAGWLPIAWALDEDLRQTKMALAGDADWCSFSSAKIIHAAWPAAISALPEAALRGKIIICQADNPPSFYLGTREFSVAAERTHHWVARSSEARSQFELLGLPVIQAPYTVDRNIFRPLPERSGIRRSLGLSDNDFVIGNFHRDSEGENLRKPKLQKGPDIFLQIARRVRAEVPNTTVLLAGPRRHWLLQALRAEGISVVFAGKEPDQIDDYGCNILPRERLNELYQALDCCVISSRWEGGPYAVLESLAAGRPVISTAVGTSRDVLGEACLFASVEGAAEILVSHALHGSLFSPCEEAATRAEISHSQEALRESLLSLYSKLPRGSCGAGARLGSGLSLVAGKFLPRQGRPHQRLDALRREIVSCAQTVSRPSEISALPENMSLEQLRETAVCIAADRQG